MTVREAKRILMMTPRPNTRTYKAMPGMSASNTLSIMMLTEGALTI